MKKLICVMLIVVSIFALSACSVKLPITATGNNLGSKVGSAALSLFDFNGDSSIATAAKNGGITKISTVDLKLFFLDKEDGLFGIKTIVTGE